jgi:hypothetical protein
MARKIAIPSEQLDRLKVLYDQEREALVALATAQAVANNAEDGLDAARRVLKEAQSGVEVAYQALVALVGAGVAAELTGRSAGGSRRGGEKRADGGDTARTADGHASPDHATSSALVGGVVG